VPDSLILVERQGVTSAQSVGAAAALMRAHGLETALVVSDSYHMMRLELLMRRAGVRPYRAPAADAPIDRATRQTRWRYVLRESVLFPAPPCSAGAERMRISLPCERFTLDNGLRVIVHEDRAHPLVVRQRLVPRRLEGRVPGRTGFAHLFEHLMFEGSENVPAGPLRRAARGGRRHQQRLDVAGPHELLGAAAVATRSSWRSGSRPTAWAVCCPPSRRSSSRRSATSS
jgi:hypothetical protein